MAPAIGNAFSVYRAVAKQAGSNSTTARALGQLRRAAERNGGVLDAKVASHLSDPLAKKVARLALRNRGAAARLPHADESPPGWKRDGDGWVRTGDRYGFSRENPRDGWTSLLFDYYGRQTQAEGEKPPQVRLEELTPNWFAAYFTFLLMVEGEEPGYLSDKFEPMTADIIRFMAVKDEVLRARAASGNATLYEERFQEARERVVLAPQLVLAQPKVLERGAQKLGTRVQEVLQELGSPAEDVLDEPGTQQELLETLRREHLDGIRIAAAEAMRASAAPLPVLNALADKLGKRGLLNKDTFKNVELFVRTHGLPSTAELVRVLTEKGGLRSASAGFKGVSTAPLAAAAAERMLKVTDPGFGDAQLQGADAERLQGALDTVFDAAAQAGRTALVLGDGRETVRACRAAAAKHPGVKVGYVELTQSGVNELRAQRSLPFDVTALAETHLKKLGESELLGQWLVERLVESAEAGDLPDPRSARVAVIGHGDVGGGVALGLQHRGAQQMRVLDRSDEALAQAAAKGMATGHWEGGQPLPPAEIYIAATGASALLDERAFRSMPNGSHVINYASRGELDEQFLERVAQGQVPGARLTVQRPLPLAEHETLVLEFEQHGGESRQVFLHKRGQPYFDGRKDKDPMLVDLYMAGLLACLAVEARQLKSAPFDSPELRSLDVELQRAILLLLEEHYPEPTYRRLLEKVHLALGVTR